MKKFTRTGKKVLSVFLAALMVMTAWVFVAPTKAEAANGGYRFKVEIQNKDNMVEWEKEYFRVTYSPNNGRSATIYTDFSLETVMKEEKTHYLEGDVNGFPTNFYIYVNPYWNRSLEIHIKNIWINDVNVWTGDDKYTCGGVGGYAKTWSKDIGQDKYPYVATSKTISVATAATDIGIPPLGDKKDVSTSTTTMQYYTTDQYGVRYEPTSYTFSGVTGLSTSGSIGNAYTATANESTTASTTAIYQTETVKLDWKNSNYTGTETEHGDSAYTFKVYNPRYKVTYNGNGGTLGTNYTYVYENQKISADTSTATSNNVAGLTAEKFPTDGIREGYTFNGIWSAASGGTQYSANTTVTKNSTAYAHWTPNKYNAVFKGNRATYPNAVQEYEIAKVATDFDSKPVAPTNVEEYDDGDYHCEFNGNWKNSAGNVYDADALPIMTTAGATYWAQYNPTFVQADYSGVTTQENEAARIKSNPNYEAIYTQSSRNNLQAALDAVMTGMGRTRQDVVDGYEQRIKEAIDALEGQKYSVVFMDGRDNSIIKFSYPNVFGDTIQYPENPSMSYDTNYHYIFSNWEGTAQETNLSTVEKNITIVAKFNKAAHSYEEEHVDSTCSKLGGTKYTCTTCGYSYTTYSGEYGEHVWSTDWTIDNPATCTQSGSKSHHCTLCDARTDETDIPALDHDYTGVEPEVIVPVSCDTIGVSIKECTRCGYNDYITTDSIGHTMKDEVTAPTCTSKGYTTSTCEICGKMLIGSFTDPIDHNYVKKESECVASSCIGVGYDVSYCSVCGLKKYDIFPAAGHNWNVDYTIDLEPTCTTKGQKSIHCSVCDIIDSNFIEEIPANGHNYDEGEVLTPATCTQDGVKAIHCTVAGCGHTKTEILPKSGHTWKDDHTIDRAATCTAEGQQSIHCSVCNAINEDSIESIAKIDHSYVETSTTATCTEAGVKTEECSVCGHTVTEVTPALGHSYDEDNKTVVDATCLEEGKITYTCTRADCGETIEIILAKLQHNYEHTYTVAPTCTTEGYEVWTCTTPNCGAQEFREKVDALNHSKKRNEHKDATCTAEGYDRTVCEYCGKILEEETIAKLAHTEQVIETAATCTEKGSKTTICSVCKTVLRETEYTPALKHDWGEWEILVEGTCAVEGKKERKCKRDGCGETEYISTGIGDHDYGEGVKTAATCTENAFITYTCTVCNKGTKIEYLDGTKLGHKYSADYKTIVLPTCHSTGIKAHYCTRCGTTEPNNGHNYVEISELAHTYGEWVITKKPTCDTNGVKVRTCTGDCTEKDAGHTETAVVAKEGHNYGEWEITKNATCLEEGSQRRYCDRCKTWEVQAIPTGGHTRVADYAVEATCTSIGHTAGSHCSVCGYVFVATKEIPMKDHYDLGGDGKCDTCGKLMTNSEGVDTCFCHKTGFAGIFYKLFVRVIWKIFNVNQTCVCGVEHYETKKK